MRYIIKILREQADQIAADGHAGWGNTMTAAADEIYRLADENNSLRQQIKEMIEANKWEVPK